MTYDGERHLLPLFDPALVDPLELKALLGLAYCLYPVPCETALQLARRGFLIDYRDDDSDYVYLARTFEDYPGRTLHAKRSLRRQFEDRSAPSSYDLTGREDSALAVLKGWMADVGKETTETDFVPCSEAIQRNAELGLVGRIVVTDQGDPVGFVIGSRLGDDCVVIHFAKGRRSCNGVYPFMFSDFVRHATGIRWLNFEQDLGNPRFRRNKRSYAPSHMIRKYRVRRNPVAGAG